MTRLGDFLHFVQLFKAFEINSPKSPTILGNFCKGVEIFDFSSEIIFGQLFTCHTAQFSNSGFFLTFHRGSVGRSIRWTWISCRLERKSVFPIPLLTLWLAHL